MCDTRRKQLIMLNFNSIIKRMRVLKDVKEYDKIWVEDVNEKIDEEIIVVKCFTIDNSYFPSVSRWWYSQNRELTINTIINDTNYIHQNFHTLSQQAVQTIINTIKDALPGIINLKKTYSSVHEHTTKLTQVIEILNKIQAGNI